MTQNSKLVAWFFGTKQEWDALEEANMLEEFVEASAQLRETYV